MLPSLYVETSVISYYTARVSRDLVVAGHQQITQDWWKNDLPRFDSFISGLVISEMRRGDPAAVQARIAAALGFGILDVAPDAQELAQAYFEALNLPASARPDALHLAVASLSGMEYLVSWNCRHIVSGRVRKVVQEINERRGVESPIICTPEELQND